MLQGLSGHLLSEAFLEGAVTPTPSEAAQRALRDLAAWRKHTWGLGPASSLRAMLNAGAEPLAATFGFDSVAEPALREKTLAATLRDGTRTIALLVTSWGEPLDPLWREAVTESLERQAPWCLLFNGTHLRNRRGTALHPSPRGVRRRSGLDNPRTFAALWAVLKAHPLEDLGQRLRSPRERCAPITQKAALTASATVLAALVAPKLGRSLNPANC